MKAPRYLISYTFTAGGGRISGSGYMDDYQPLFNGKPSVLMPEHMKTIAPLVSEGVRRDTGHTDTKVTITHVWRYETDGEVSEESREPLDTV